MVTKKIEDADSSNYLSCNQSHLDNFKPPSPTYPDLTPNVAIEVFCQILKEVLSSASASELASLFHNGQEACPLRAYLKELGHPAQPLTTPIQTSNSTAAGIANNTIKQKHSKAMDVCFLAHANCALASNLLGSTDSSSRHGAANHKDVAWLNIFLFD